jgi:hypothetical protein
MTRAVWWHCFAGIAGDMAFASLLDAGADLDEVLAGLAKLPVGGWHVEVAKTVRGGLAATRLQVHVDSSDEPVERTWGTVRAMLDGAHDLPERARTRAHHVFARLAAAEGRLHGLAPDEVHFHEVGATDALVDVLGTCLALESLDVASVWSSPLALGMGTTRAAHGPLPNPAPAVVELLSGVPVRGHDLDVELTTPTGAAIVAALAASFGPPPPMRLVAAGYGAGSRDLQAMPNVLQVLVGELDIPFEATRGPAVAGFGDILAGGAYEQLVVLEANLDDVTGELLAHTLGLVLEAGALDAWLVPLVGKKGRPAHVVTVLAVPELAANLAKVLVSETGTLGLREHYVGRWALPRRELAVDIEGETVRVKAGPYRLKAEHDDCVRAASHLGRPVAEVARRAEQAAELLQGPIA